MGSPFDALVAGVLAPAISAQFGRAFQLAPKMRPSDVNAPFVADPSRAVATFLADFRVTPAKPLMTDAYDPRANRRPGIEAQHPIVRVQPDQPVSFAEGDLLLDLTTSVTWRVTSLHTTSRGVRELKVNLVG